MDKRKCFYRGLQMMCFAIFFLSGGFALVCRNCAYHGLAAHTLLLMWKYVKIYLLILLIIRLEAVYKSGGKKKDILN